MKAKIAAAGVLSALILGGTGTAVALSRAPEANADEQSYLHNLYSSGFYGPAAGWLRMGYTVCSMVAGGANQYAVTDYIYHHTSDETDWATSARAVELVEIYLC